MNCLKLGLGLAVLASLSVLACGGADGVDDEEGAVADDALRNDPTAIVIRAGDSGRTVAVPLGRSFTIALDEKSGERWEVESVGRALGQPRSSLVRGRDGAPGSRRLTWATGRSESFVGAHTIALALRRRPLFGAATTLASFSVTVDVKSTSGPRKCGGSSRASCSGDELCVYSRSACGSGSEEGTCQRRPDACAPTYAPVCGCNGVQYDNTCYANSAGASVAHAGPCASSSSGGGAAAGERCGSRTCAVGEVCCNPLAGICTKPDMVCIQ